MPDIPAATARRQSGWGTPLPLPYPKQICCNSTTASLPAASPAPSAHHSSIPAGHAFAIKGRAHGQDWSPAIKIGALPAAAAPWLPLPLFPAMKIEAIAVRQAIAEDFQRRR